MNLCRRGVDGGGEREEGLVERGEKGQLKKKSRERRPQRAEILATLAD